MSSNSSTTTIKMKPVTEATTEAINKTSTMTTTEVITKTTTENIISLIPNFKNSTSPCKNIKTIQPKKAARKFDGWSFFGGILLTLGIMAIALVAYKYFIAKKSRTSNLNYSLM